MNQRLIAMTDESWTMPITDSLERLKGEEPCIAAADHSIVASLE